MDTSKENILMCEKAEEIQTERPKGMSGIVTNTYYGLLSIELKTKRKDFRLFGIIDNNLVQEGSIWLPHQDQLQKIILIDWIGKKPCWLLFKFYNWVNLAKKENVWITDYTSMEQLWLAFVMRVKYNKTWNGKEWVK